MTLISAVAICAALKQHLGLQAQIKWPNDILLNNRKLGGILTELSAEMDRVHAIIIGVGMNINTEQRVLPEAATSLKEATGSEVSRLELLRAILVSFEKIYLQFQKQGIEKILQQWRDFSATLGKRVKLTTGRQAHPLVGEAVDIGQDGGLLIRKDSGVMERVMAGDVVHCKR